MSPRFTSPHVATACAPFTGIFALSNGHGWRKRSFGRVATGPAMKDGYGGVSARAVGLDYHSLMLPSFCREARRDQTHE